MQSQEVKSGIDLKQKSSDVLMTNIRVLLLIICLISVRETSAHLACWQVTVVLCVGCWH